MRGSTVHATPDDGGPTRIVTTLTRDYVIRAPVAALVQTLIHELSHPILSPSVLGQAFKPIQRDLAGLIADHPQVQARRQGAADPAEARRDHVSLISQLIYERTSYAEAELYVHMQEFSAPGADTHEIVFRMTDFSAQLIRMQLPPHILRLTFESVRVRALALYDRRIAAARGNPRLIEWLRHSRGLADLALRMAREQILNVP